MGLNPKRLIHIFHITQFYYYNGENSYNSWTFATLFSYLSWYIFYRCLYCDAKLKAGQTDCPSAQTLWKGSGRMKNWECLLKEEAWHTFGCDVCSHTHGHGFEPHAGHISLCLQIHFCSFVPCPMP